MLQCVAVCCSVLQCVAVCCSVLQCVAVCELTLKSDKRADCYKKKFTSEIGELLQSDEDFEIEISPDPPVGGGGRVSD